MGKKILILRFSSIGDIVLTTPVLRCLRRQLEGVRIHYATKEVFRPILESNPNVDKLHTFKEDVSDLYEELEAEKFDLIIDLHRNVRSFKIKRKLKVEARSFNKINVQKYIAVNFKVLGLLPALHIVDRYLKTLEFLGVHNDGAGLDYYIPDKDRINVPDLFFKGRETKFIGLVVGGSYYTKQIPINKLREICANAILPVILLGDKSDIIVAAELQSHYPEVINTCGQLSINQSASIVQQAEWIITSDTGLMHIASAFGKKIISVWGNTIPQFGMGPYLPAEGSGILEVEGLSCRPCSKLGYKKCPLDHFKCMNEIDYSFVQDLD